VLVDQAMTIIEPSILTSLTNFQTSNHPAVAFGSR
jgi:hypothetical protein